MNVSWSTPAESTAHGTPAAAAVTAALRLGGSGVRQLEHLGTALHGDPGRIRDQLREGGLVVLLALVLEAVGEDLDDQQKALGLAGLDQVPDLVAHPGVRALLVRAQVEQHLRDVAAQLPHATRGHAVDVVGVPQPVDGLEPRGVHADDEGGVASEGCVVDDPRQCHLGVEQDRGSVVPEVSHQVRLRLGELVGGDGAGSVRRIGHHRLHAVALVRGDDQHPAGRRRDRGHAASFEGGEFIHGVSSIGGRAGARGRVLRHRGACVTVGHRSVAAPCAAVSSASTRASSRAAKRAAP